MKTENKPLRLNTLNSNNYTDMTKAINSVSDINADSTPEQISAFVGNQIREFIEKQLSEEVKPITPMDKLTSGYEKLISSRNENNNGSQLFNSILQTAISPKSRGTK